MKKTETFKAVEKLLEENTKSHMTGVGPRDSDKELNIQFIQRVLGMNLNAEQLTLLRTVNFESIRRGRQKLQEAGKFPPDDPEVARRRRIKSYEIEQTAATESAAGLQRRIEENE